MQRREFLAGVSAGAAAIGVAMLSASFVILLLINTLQRWAANR